MTHSLTTSSARKQVQALLPPALKALPAARVPKSTAKAQAREPGRMSADELRDVLRMLRLQQP